MTGYLKKVKTRQNLDLSYVTIKEILDEVEISEEETCNKLCKMATKEDIQELLKCNKSRKSFQPTGFSGKTSENAREFLSTFDNYSKLNNIDGEDKLLSFEMCLSGAAKCWYNGLTMDIQKDYAKLKEEFNKNFVKNCQWLNTARLENRRLLANESAEKYITEVSELAQLVGVTDSELSKALIRGLPHRLKWHVVSFNPGSLSDTIQRILLGEATLAMEGSGLGTTECHTLEDRISSYKVNENIEKLAERFTQLEAQFSELKQQSTHKDDRFATTQTMQASCGYCGRNNHHESRCFRRPGSARGTMGRGRSVSGYRNNEYNQQRRSNNQYGYHPEQFRGNQQPQPYNNYYGNGTKNDRASH